MTLGRFYRERFEPNYVQFQRPATREAYGTLWRNHLSALENMPIRAIDIDTIDDLRSKLAKKGLKETSINVNLGKLGKMLRWALQRKLIDGLPLIERIKVVPQQRPHYDEDQVEQLRKALATSRRRTSWCSSSVSSAGCGPVRSRRCAGATSTSASDSSRFRGPCTAASRVRPRAPSAMSASPTPCSTRSPASSGAACECSTGARSTPRASTPRSPRPASRRRSTASSARSSSTARASTSCATAGSRTSPTAARTSTPCRRSPATRGCRRPRGTSTSPSNGW
jgi:hypothetical protein